MHDVIMHVKLPYRHSGEVTLMTGETFVTLVCLHVNFVLPPIREVVSTSLAFLCRVSRVEFLDVDFEVCFTSTGCGAELTLENWLVAGVNQLVGLENAERIYIYFFEVNSKYTSFCVFKTSGF